MVLDDGQLPFNPKYVYVVRNTCSLSPDVSNICLEMYISYDDYDENILSKHRRVAEHLKVPIYVDVYQEHTDKQTMLLYTTYTFNSTD